MNGMRFLSFDGLESFDIFYICHNNIHGDDLFDSSVENLHLAYYRVVPGHGNHLNDPASDFLSTH